MCFFTIDAPLKHRKIPVFLLWANCQLTENVCFLITVQSPGNELAVLVPFFYGIFFYSVDSADGQGCRGCRGCLQLLILHLWQALVKSV